MTKGLLVVIGLGGSLALYTAFGVRQVEQAFPPIGNFIAADGLQLHYVDTGSGPPVVLIHGASTNLRDFSSSLVPVLAKENRVLAFDRPGHGYSERPQNHWPHPAAQASYLHAALNALGVERPLLVGHSWSGAVVLAYLLKHPESAAGGVLLAGASHPWKGGVAWTNTLGGIPVLGRLFASTLVHPVGRLMLNSAIAEVFKPESPPSDYVGHTGVLLTLRPRNFLANAEDIRLLSDYLQDQSQRYADIQRPLLLIHGTADDVVPAWNHADRLIKVIPNAKLVRLAQVGHALHHTQTEPIARLIMEFSRSVQ
ncbi:MAG: alpha/beta hydrolase [bacterium]|nr:alpha/beta hydrolase [bacterium]